MLIDDLTSGSVTIHCIRDRTLEFGFDDVEITTGNLLPVFVEKLFE